MGFRSGIRCGTCFGMERRCLSHGVVLGVWVALPIAVGLGASWIRSSADSWRWLACLRQVVCRVCVCFNFRWDVWGCGRRAGGDARGQADGRASSSRSSTAQAPELRLRNVGAPQHVEHGRRSPLGGADFPGGSRGRRRRGPILFMCVVV